MNAAAGALDAQGRVRRLISIKGLLEWAFADECASVDFEDTGTLARGFAHIGNAGRMAERGALGCRIDGGGQSYPDADADLVASAVATLDDFFGGRRMAVLVAELARARQVPDLLTRAVPRCVPVGMRQNQHGARAIEQSIGTVIDVSGRKAKRVDVRICPVRYTVTAADIQRARSNYLQWRLALSELRQTFVIANNLSRWQVSEQLPALAPWKKTFDE